jgi:hypothetical protein
MCKRMLCLSGLALPVLLHSCTVDQFWYYRVQGVVLLEGVPLAGQELVVTITNAPQSDPDQVNSISLSALTDDLGSFRAEDPRVGGAGPPRLVFSVEICVAGAACITIPGDAVEQFEEEFIFRVLDVGTVKLGPGEAAQGP